jgi:transposase
VSETFHPSKTSTPLTTSSSHDELLEQLKSQLATPLYTAISGQLTTLQNTLVKLQYAELKIQLLEERLRLHRIEKYGPASERLNNQQLELLELEPGVSHEEVEAESEREALPSSSAKKRKHPGRQTLPANLPRVERVISCTADQCVCGGCGAEKTVIGYEESEQLDVDPAKYFVLVTKREKRACKSCEELGVVAAPLPERIIEKSIASDRVIIDTVVNKYCDHAPLYRQSVILLRDAGIEISRATLDGWVMRVGDILTPIVGVMGRQLLSGTYIQADETPVDVQMGDGRGKDHHAYMWQYGKPRGEAIFQFRMGRGREGPKRFLGNLEGILQTDDYAGYDHVGGPTMVHASCWAHSRRKFFDAVKLNKQDVACTQIVALMDKLFAVDAQAREEKMDHATRHTLRQQHARPLLEEIRSNILATSKNVLPKSAAGKACSYTLALWQKLTRFLDYPEIELSNNLAENSMRPVALGRKNWIHLGSEHAGPRIAAILSIVESCRRLKISVRDYLGEVLPGLADTPIQRLSELTPAAWAANNNSPANHGLL